MPTIYDAVRGTAYFRAPVFGELARRAAGHEVSLQVDNVDGGHLTGWTVQMTGTAHRVEDTATVASLWSFGRPQPWFPGVQTQWIALPVADVRGQRVSDHRYAQKSRAGLTGGAASAIRRGAADRRRLNAWENEGGRVQEPHSQG